MDENTTPTDRVRNALNELRDLGVPQEEIDKIQVYQMEQTELAEELYRSAVADGVNFATADDEGDVYVNTKWLGMIVHTVAESMLVMPDVDPSTMRTAEVLNQTIMAANRFVGKAI
jgi:hypothetical protein